MFLIELHLDDVLKALLVDRLEFLSDKTFIEVWATKKLIKEKMTGRVAISHVWENCQKVKIEVTGLKKV